MSSTSEVENLRDEALKLAAEVQQTLSITQTFKPSLPETQILTETASQEVIPITAEAAMEECGKYLRRVQDRFAASDIHDTYAKLLDIMIAHIEGKLSNSEFHGKVCTLLFGHADLFSDLERFLSDGSEESRHEIEKFRVQIRQDFERKIEVELGNYRSTAQRMEEIQKAPEGTPGKITGLHVEYIERACLSDDPGMRWQVMIDLVTNPRSVCHLVPPCLENKQKALRRMRAFVWTIFIKFLRTPFHAINCKFRQLMMQKVLTGRISMLV